MATKKTIAIIKASGHMGSAIVKILANKNHRLLLFCEECEKLNDVLTEIRENVSGSDIELMGCPIEASWEADIIILTVAPSEEEKFAELIRAFATGKIVISMSNLHRGIRNKDDKRFKPEAVKKLAELLPHSKIIKAFEGPIMDGEILDRIINEN
ncbi:MAG: hypothetical protein C5B59_20500 [Bacteroidetes bacterium]|nr:MAG: hypothetical protein C5B59_20500 [Bacteroidota bacterium]